MEDNIFVFDALPSVIRNFIADSITPWNSVQIADALAKGMAIGEVLRQLRWNEQVHHVDGVRRGLIPRINSGFVLRPIRERRRRR